MFEFLPGSGAFALAGLLAAAGPLVLHLLNRQRHRVIHWAAMDFLDEAIRQRRRWLLLRNWLLMGLRMLSVLLFGLALARPYLATAGTTVADPPTRWTVIVDNSLSMGYEQLGGRLLDTAKAKARQLVEQLPRGTPISIIAMCGTRQLAASEDSPLREDALQAIDEIELTDRAGNIAQSIQQAYADEARDRRARQVVIIGDRQAINWQAASSLAEDRENRREVLFVPVAAEELTNTWIESFAVEEGPIDLSAPAVFSAVVRHESLLSRCNIQATLSVDGTPIASQTFCLEPGESHPLRFRHQFTGPGRAVPVSLHVSPDRLPGDDVRYLAVQLLPPGSIAFVDQWGAEETPAQGRLGESYCLRRLWASRADGDVETALPPAHWTVADLSQAALKDVRLLVLAGVREPAGCVPLLREFVQQGGQLLIAAGGDFDPAAWNDMAWLAGAGILPTALAPQISGGAPSGSDELRVFQLAAASLADDAIRPEGLTAAELEELCGAPLFFQVLEALPTSPANAAPASSSATAPPAWLTWAQADPQVNSGSKSYSRVTESARVLAQFDNELPWIVERPIGRGSVVLITSGLTSADWTTLARSGAVLLVDHLMRHLLARTLPPEACSTASELSFIVSRRQDPYGLERPDGTRQTLFVEQGAGHLAQLTLRGLPQRGIYRVDSSPENSTGEQAVKNWELPLALNGPAGESQLGPLPPQEEAERCRQLGVRVVDHESTLRVSTAGMLAGGELWRWFALGVLLLLGLELALLARRPIPPEVRP